MQQRCTRNSINALIVMMGMLLLLASCRNRHHKVNRSIYYWKTNFSTTGYIGQRLHDVQCKNIYLHCFDVDWNMADNKAEPIAVIRFSDRSVDRAFRYVPVVFITQPVLRHLKGEEIPVLAAHIARLLQDLLTKENIVTAEIQIDCDWTAGTKDTYFMLLQELRKQAFFKGRQLSCTIRLHQLKYRIKSGVPPVDKGLLMCYNLGDLKRPGDHNSILNTRLVEDYLDDADAYPLKLDVALPLFGWCVQFRGNAMKGILREVTPAMVKGASVFKHQTGNIYTCTEDTVWHGYDFIRGDNVRLEEPALNDIKDAASFTAKKLKNDTLSVILFHADSLTLNKYSNDDLEAIYNAYH